MDLHLSINLSVIYCHIKKYPKTLCLKIPDLFSHDPECQQFGQG